MHSKRIFYDSHALVYNDTRNTMKARNIPDIALNPSKMNGGHYFMYLHSVKVLHIYQWKELSIDDKVIERVESIALE